MTYAISEVKVHSGWTHPANCVKAFAGSGWGLIGGEEKQPIKETIDRVQESFKYFRNKNLGYVIRLDRSR